VAPRGTWWRHSRGTGMFTLSEGEQPVLAAPRRERRAEARTRGCRANTRRRLRHPGSNPLPGGLRAHRQLVRNIVSSSQSTSPRNMPKRLRQASALGSGPAYKPFPWQVRYAALRARNKTGRLTGRGHPAAIVAASLPGARGGSRRLAKPARISGRVAVRWTRRAGASRRPRRSGLAPCTARRGT
jgi:hypothetical protein